MAEKDEHAQGDAPREGAESQAAGAPPAEAPNPAPAPRADAGDGEDSGSSRAVAVGAVLLVLIVGGVLASFALSKGGDEAPRKAAAPPPPAVWTDGQMVDVVITVLPEDRENLACVSTVEVAGRHCGYETQTTEWTKPDEAGVNDDKHLLKPYATTGRERFLAAGLWSEPALENNLPTKRFSVKCKYKVEGKIKNPTIRWGKAGPWKPMNNDWYAGVLSGCSVIGS